MLWNQYEIVCEPVLKKPNPDDIHSVHSLTMTVKYKLNQLFPSVWVSGEVTGLSRPSSGHIYFSIKDEQAMLGCVIWRSNAERMNFDLENGMELLCYGGIDVYERRGDYKLHVQRAEPQGTGPLQIKFKQLKDKLEKQGLFDKARKQPIPKMPKRIAVVTSPTGAAIRDFLQVLNRRWSGLEIIIVPVKVQGPGSATEIAEAIKSCARFAPQPDVIVVTRGGGSLEDLWSFNEESVCRAIFASPIPVVSGVGHEIDVTLSDLTADKRALTPSEAAEILTPNLPEILSTLDSAKRRLRFSLVGKLKTAKAQLETLSSRPVLNRPLEFINRLSLQVDELEQRSRLALQTQIDRSSSQIKELTARIEAMNPLAVLARGYSLTSNEQGRLLKDIKAIKIGDAIQTRLPNGIVHSRVEKVAPTEKDHGEEKT